MTTPSYSSGEPIPFFNFKEHNLADMPLPETEENQFDCWDDQLNSSALELHSPMPSHSPVNETSGLSTAMPRTDSLWDERTTLVGMPTNSKAALAAIMLEQDSPEGFNLYGTDQVAAAAAPPEMTDQFRLQRLKGRAGTGIMIWTKMMRNPVFGIQCGAFMDDFFLAGKEV